MLLTSYFFIDYTSPTPTIKWGSVTSVPVFFPLTLSVFAFALSNPSFDEDFLHEDFRAILPALEEGEILRLFRSFFGLQEDWEKLLSSDPFSVRKLVRKPRRPKTLIDNVFRTACHRRRLNRRRR